ncbi:hypothetical protein MNBD_GAMMA08-1968 [hydrothermal vent metagenome]|uniref:Uncharacterized protein n=1 Tax=hydrothermal vent metagenome TaxID=652676 RepID=A0A3B0XQC0_9ZZZZ
MLTPISTCLFLYLKHLYRAQDITEQFHQLVGWGDEETPTVNVTNVGVRKLTPTYIYRGGVNNSEPVFMCVTAKALH